MGKPIDELNKEDWVKLARLEHTAKKVNPTLMKMAQPGIDSKVSGERIIEEVEKDTTVGKAIRKAEDIMYERTKQKAREAGLEVEGI